MLIQFKTCCVESSEIREIRHNPQGTKLLFTWDGKEILMPDTYDEVIKKIKESTKCLIDSGIKNNGQGLMF